MPFPIDFDSMRHPDDVRHGAAHSDDQGDGGHGGEPSSNSQEASAEGAPGATAAEPPGPADVQEPRRQDNGIATSPTAAQIESHGCSGHIQFEPWCIDCIRGRGHEWAHFKADRSEDEVPTLLWDYAFLSSDAAGLSDEADEAEQDRRGSCPLLVCWDSSVKRFWCWLLPSKGVDFEGLENSLHTIVIDLKHTGYRKVNMRSDGEASLLALLRAISVPWDIHCIPQVSAP